MRSVTDCCVTGCDGVWNAGGPGVLARGSSDCCVQNSFIGVVRQVILRARVFFLEPAGHLARMHRPHWRCGRRGVSHHLPVILRHCLCNWQQQPRGPPFDSNERETIPAMDDFFPERPPDTLCSNDSLLTTLVVSPYLPRNIVIINSTSSSPLRCNLTTPSRGSSL